MKDYETWHERYLKKEFINIKEHLDSNDIEYSINLESI